MVKHYFFNHTGAPQLSGQAGSLAAVLNACLCNGYNLTAVSELRREGSEAIAVCPTGHGLREGQVVLIAGANEPAYNGEQAIRGVTTTTFRFPVPADAPTPASGTITVKVAPLGWEAVYSGPSKAVYRPRDPVSNRLYLRLDETPLAGDPNLGRGARTAVAQLYEAMSDVDTGTGKAETWWRKSATESATPRPWVLVGDRRRFWLCVAWSESFPNRYVPYCCGDLASYKPGDAYGVLLGGYFDLGNNGNDPGTNQLLDAVHAVGTPVGNTGIQIARAYPQLGGKVNALWVSGPAAAGAVAMGATGLPYPNPADAGIYVAPLLVQEQLGPSLRGRLPGLYCPLHPIVVTEPTRFDGFLLDGAVRSLLVLPGAQSIARYALDLTGPWD